MSLSPDAKAVVRAADALTTQVRRIADALSTPSAVIRDGVMTPLDDAPTTGSDGVHHRLAQARNAAALHRHRLISTAELYAAIEADAAPAADEDALRTDRRDSLLVLLSRARRGVLTPDEAAQLQQHVETELRAGDRAREKAGDLAEACKTERRRADQVEELLRVAHETSNRSEAERARADRIRAEAQRDRDQHAAVLAEVLRHFTEHGHPGAPCVRTGWIRTSTVDQWRSVVAPTVERPWWQQVAAARAELAEAQAAIERVRSARDGIAELASYADGGAADAFGVVLHRLTAALDGTEQPTTTKE